MFPGIRPTSGSFASPYLWAGSACDGVGIGCAEIQVTGDEIDSATVWIDDSIPERQEHIATIVHEILHALGRMHADPYMFLDSAMKAIGAENSGFILYQLDRDALFAVYDRLDAGTSAHAIYNNLGPWADTSDVLVGVQPIDSVDVVFGVAGRNGLLQPWATGPQPSAWLEDNDQLFGTATWSGRILGFTPRNEVVGAKTDMTVHLSTLDGRIDFTAMEAWGIGDAPGKVGTGGRWGDGDLYYPIRVDGNLFERTFEGGDEGEVNGAFFGPAHEGMGGTLRRDDLTAAFGGTR